MSLIQDANPISCKQNCLSYNWDNDIDCDIDEEIWSEHPVKDIKASQSPLGKY